MKRRFLWGVAMSLLIPFSSCSVDEINGQDQTPQSFEDGIESIDAFVEPFEGDEADTKSTLTYDGSFNWEMTDKLVFWPEADKNFSGNVIGVPFRISNITNKDGKSYATFDGKGWALKKGAKYYAATPYVDGSTSAKVTVDYSGQKQHGDNGESHLGDYDFMHTSFTTPTNGDNASITFKHLGAMRKFVLNLPENVIAAGPLTLSAKERIFCEEASYNPSVNAGSVVFTKADSNMKNTIRLDVDDVPGESSLSFPSGSHTVTYNMMMIPTEWENKEITVSIDAIVPGVESGTNSAYSFIGVFVPEKNALSGTRGTYSIDMKNGSLNSSRYLTFSVDDSSSSTVSLIDVDADQPDFEYSYDKISWRKWDYSGLDINSSKPVYIRGNNPDGLHGGRFSFSGTGKVRCQGSIMSLLSYEEDLFVIPNDECFSSLFMNCSQLIEAPELPATTLSPYCYHAMFKGCTSLTTAPELPANIEGPFVTKAPDFIFAEFCYSHMFEGCISLTTPPDLPATWLSNGCYNSMFYGCTSLTYAPELPAKRLELDCYSYMFYGCTNLNYIKIMADSWAELYMYNWTAGVAPTGTFVMNADARNTIHGVSGIPDGWSVQYVGYSNGHEYVDLGLPSGTMWATMNIGASSPERYGDFFAWGETQTKSDYDWSTYKWSPSLSDKGITKYTNPDGYTAGIWYNANGQFIGDNKTSLDPEDDAAVQIWKGDWRMPTWAEEKELRENCYWEWTDSYRNTGIKGYIVYRTKSDTDKGKGYNSHGSNGYSNDYTTPVASYTLLDSHIFLPAAGVMTVYGREEIGSCAYFWSSSLRLDYSPNAYYLGYGAGLGQGTTNVRYQGYSIRPVLKRN